MTGRQIRVDSQRAANYLPQMHHHICLFTFACGAELDRHYFDQSFFFFPFRIPTLCEQREVNLLGNMLIQKYEQLQEKATILYRGNADGEVLGQLLVKTVDTQST